MLRLTLILCAVIYAGLIIYSDGVSDDGASIAAADVAEAPATDQPVRALVRDGDTTTLTTTDGAVLRIAATINPNGAAGRAIEVAAISTVGPETVTASASAPAPEDVPQLPLLQVTGTTVNLRDGPSTDTQVIGSLTRGAEAYLVQAVGNGWAQIRVVDTGIEGFMADRFLAQVN